MYNFGVGSKKRLEKVHPDLIKLAYAVLEVINITVVSGKRSELEQKILVDTGKSKTMRSKHLVQDDGFAHAIDIAPYPINWSDRSRFYFMCGVTKAKADELGIKIRMGCDWDGDNSFSDQTFHDLPHIELIT